MPMLTEAACDEAIAEAEAYAAKVHAHVHV